VAGGTVGYTGPGAFVVAVAGTGSAVDVTAGGKAVVTGVRILADHVFGAFAGGDGSQIVVDGDIRAEGEQDGAVGAYAAGGGLVTVNGAIWIEGGNSTGARADWGSMVIVQAGSGEAITVTGDYAVGVGPYYGGEVVVGGDVVAIGGSAAGVFAPGGIARINGDVTATGAWSIGAASSDDGQVTVTGEVTASGMESTGIYAHVGEGSGGIVDVAGSVTVTGTGALGVEAYSREGVSKAERNETDWSGKSLVTIRGQLGAPNYLKVDGEPRAIDSQNGEDPSGFWLYLGPHGSRVKIRNGQPTAGPPTAVTKPVTGIMTTAADLSGEVTSDGGAKVGERGFVYATSPDPTLANGTKVLAGSGTGPYDATLSGLRPGTGYYVRAYATNSEGTGYGSTQPFVTQSEPTVDPTPTPTPDPSETPDPTPDDTTRPEPSDPASERSDSDELPVTGAGEGRLGWLLGLMAATVLGGLLILFGKDRVVRRRE
ncbi:MAG: hypothetical protein KIT69_03525, partial [Propionibacteriaceae bacterium]|nr:hypothetical protein [Propionibacteriaceae bacterium]